MPADLTVGRRATAILGGVVRFELCTLLDRRYLARGLVLYHSLRRFQPDTRLRVFCMDREAKRALDELALTGLVTTSLEELEDYAPELRSVKASRSWLEYLWTATPATCLFTLKHSPQAQGVVRLDADVEFYANPALLLDQLGEGSVLLTPHRPAPEFRDLGDRDGEWGGTFNVQCEVFRRDESGIAALRWWHERCIEWCYDRFEPGRYGDQKYLDELPSRFGGVRVNQHPGAGLAPWNVAAHRLEQIGGSFTVDGKPLLFHHFQSLELHSATRAARTIAACSRSYRLTDGKFPLVWTTGWRLTDDQLDALWEPHVTRIGRALAELRGRSAAEYVALPPLRVRRVAFHVARRQIPASAKLHIWRLREAAWRRRPAWRVARRAVATFAGRTYARTERALERLLVDRRLHLPPEASSHITLDQVGFDAPGRRSYQASPWGVIGRVLPADEVNTDDVFLDLGCGMGRVLLEATRYPFRRVIGVDVVPQFTAIAREAVARNAPSLPCQDVSVVTADALDYEIPDDVTVVYLAAPFNEVVMQQIIEKLVASVDDVPRSLRIIYLFPPDAPRLDEFDRIRRVRNGKRRIRRWARAEYLVLYAISERADRAPSVGPAIPSR
jgi:SAM-dependent methyltransferase